MCVGVKFNPPELRSGGVKGIIDAMDDVIVVASVHYIIRNGHHVYTGV